MSEDRGVALNEPLFGIPELASRLAISPATAWRLVNDGEIPTVRVRNRRLVDPADLSAFIAARKGGVPLRGNDDHHPQNAEGPAGTEPSTTTLAAADGRDDTD